MRRPALFLDRDGVIIEDAGYTKDPERVKLLPGIDKVLIEAEKKGYFIFVVTNQSGIGREIITLNDYLLVTLEMIRWLNSKTLPHPYHICFAPFYDLAPRPPQGNLTYDLSSLTGIPHTGVWDPNWRKPKSGMIQYLHSSYSIDLERSAILGDRWTDMLILAQMPLMVGYWLCLTPESQALAKQKIEENKHFEFTKKIRVVSDLHTVSTFL